MQQNGHLYYRSYHFHSNNQTDGFGDKRTERDVTDTQTVIDVKPVSSSHQEIHPS